MRDEPSSKTGKRAVVASADAIVPTNAGSGSLRLMGYSAKETSNAAASSLRIVNAATAAGADGTGLDDLAEVSCGAANGKDSAWYGPNGIAAEKGISIVFIAGSTDIVLFWRRG